MYGQGRCPGIRQVRSGNWNLNSCSGEFLLKHTKEGKVMVDRNVDLKNPMQVGFSKRTSRKHRQKFIQWPFATIRLSNKWRYLEGRSLFLVSFAVSEPVKYTVALRNLYVGYPLCILAARSREANIKKIWGYVWQKNFRFILTVVCTLEAFRNSKFFQNARNFLKWIGTASSV
jgi:hypothetical protein